MYIYIYLYREIDTYTSSIPQNHSHIDYHNSSRVFPFFRVIFCGIPVNRFIYIYIDMDIDIDIDMYVYITPAPPRTIIGQWQVDRKPQLERWGWWWSLWVGDGSDVQDCPRFIYLFWYIRIHTVYRYLAVYIYIYICLCVSECVQCLHIQPKRLRRVLNLGFA